MDQDENPQEQTTEEKSAESEDPATRKLTFRRADPKVLGPLVENGTFFSVGRLLRQANSSNLAHLGQTQPKFSIPEDLVTDTQEILLYFIV